MYKVRPKKSLGQHFLKDLTIAERIVDTIADFKEYPILEIGPGMGVLTNFLVAKGHDLTVVEIDRESVPYLEEHFPQLNGKIIEADFLKMKLENFYDKPFCVIGNFPYNISSQIFFKVIDYKDQIPCCSGMIQKEVAERMAAGPGNKTYGILSVLMQAWYNIEYLFTVSETVFTPPPKVKSAVIRMIRNEVSQLACDEVLFKSVVKTSFNQRRKMMRNSLKPLLGNECELYVLPVFNKRPEQLSVAQFVELTQLIEQHQKTTLQKDI